MGASITIERRVEWIDTDAAGIWHYSTAIRFAEAAETALHRRLGIGEMTSGGSPRVRVEFDFHAPLQFDEEASITLTVADVGTTSLTMDVTIVGEVGLIATGRVISVLIDPATGRPLPWPPAARAALESSG
jgi:acyl-CoA thioester hydrolase